MWGKSQKVGLTAKEKGQPESCPENTLCVLFVLHTNFINK